MIKKVFFLDEMESIFLNYFKIVIPYLVGISIFIMVISLLSIKWLVNQIPSDYLIKNTTETSFNKLPVPLRILIFIFKNLLGYLLILGGMIMLILPGQGLLTMMVGLVLSDYPGKKAFEKKIIASEPILKTINWARKKSGVKPLITEN